MYKLILEKKATDSLNKLEYQIRKRIWNKLQESKDDPFRFFEKLVEDDSFKLRVGDYRVIADIFRDKEVIIVLKVGHRKNIYER
ncbi:type II toxin-antitoxin system RelE/ParE family toxin [Candidatus Pacearchaeota archaeon CG10_big_fil_rev_8_21_14_0_10_32_14]|nr:MAG: type II toxin-antitoxin system RelE/ParE family toxin [Candidatus Pacearchaeota archaeon CG10_big_fil_rev_8_21_14_0_10_32_14]